MDSPMTQNTGRGRFRTPDKPTAAERQQAREVSLGRIARLFTPYRWPVLGVVAIIMAASVVGLATPVPAPRRHRRRAPPAGRAPARPAHRRHGRGRRDHLRARRRADLAEHPDRAARHARAAHRRVRAPAAAVAGVLHQDPHRRGAVPDHQRHRRHAERRHLDGHLDRLQPDHHGGHRGRDGRALVAALAGLARRAAARHLAARAGSPGCAARSPPSSSASSPTSTSPSRRACR